MVEHVAPHKRAKVEVVLVDDKRDKAVADVSVKNGTLEDLPPVERARSKPKRQSAVATNGRVKIKSNAPKAKAVDKTAAGHPYLRRGEYAKRRR